MTKIITIKYEQGQRSLLTLPGIAENLEMLTNINPNILKKIPTVCSDAKSALEEAMDLLAESYVNYGRQADFGIVDSNDIFDIGMSNQNFFPNYVEKALRKREILDVKVSSCMASTSYKDVLNEIKKFGQDIEYLDDVRLWGTSVIYRFERRK